MSIKKIPEVLTEQEQEALLSVFNERYISGHRNKVMIRLTLDSGLRLSEFINLKWADINLQTGQLKVRQGKGKKDRMLWIGGDTLKQLQQWRERQADKIQTGYVFSTRDGNRLNPRDVRKTVVLYAKKAGITKQIGPHTLRHTFATDMYRATKNIRQTQKALGHADLSTTMIYTHIVDDELEQAMKTFRNK